MHNESKDAIRTYLRYLNALSRLHWMHGLKRVGFVAAATQPINRIPGGATRRSCHCYHNEPLHGNDHLPAPTRIRRPTCIVFDELDPIAALEESFEFSRHYASRETLFVEHKAVQTDDHIDFTPLHFHHIFPNPVDPSFEQIEKFLREEQLRKETSGQNSPSNGRSTNKTEDRRRPSLRTETPPDIATQTSENYFREPGMRTENTADSSTQTNEDDFRRPSLKSQTPSERSFETNEEDFNRPNIENRRRSIKDETPSQSLMLTKEEHFKRPSLLEYPKDESTPENSNRSSKKHEKKKKKKDIERSEKPSNHSKRSNTFHDSSQLSNGVQHTAIISRFWNKFTSHPTITVNSRRRLHRSSNENAPEAKDELEKERESEDESEPKSCRKCDIIPLLGHQLSRIHFTIERLEAEVDHLQSEVKALKSQRRSQDATKVQSESIERKPIKVDSKNYIVVCRSANPVGSTQDMHSYRTFKIPKAAIGMRQPRQRIPFIEKDKNTMDNERSSVVKETLRKPELDKALGQPNQATNHLIGRSCLCDCQEVNPAPITKDFTPCTCIWNKSTSQRIHEAKELDRELPERDPAAQDNLQQVLDRQLSSVCQFCANKEQPVLENLDSELCRVIGDRPFNNIMLSILLRADNVYHVNVQLRHSNVVLGCLLASHAAIEKAINQDIFKKILTYSVIDVRNTIKPVGRPFGIPFEFIAKPQNNNQHNTKHAEHVERKDSRTQEFITNVLGIPADKIKKDFSDRTCL